MEITIDGAQMSDEGGVTESNGGYAFRAARWHLFQLGLS
jgi:hypothetical protein